MCKLTPAAIAFIFVLAGCHGADQAANGSHEDSVAPGRPSLIAELKAIHRLLTGHDKRTIANLFSYPVPDSVGHFHSEDSTLDPELDKNGGKMTRDIFLRHFDGIDPDLQFDQFNKVFEMLPVDSLLYTDKLEAEDDTANEPCTYFYRIEVEGDTLVRITYGVSSVNPNYSASAAKDARRKTGGDSGDSAKRAGAAGTSGAPESSGIQDSATRAAEDSAAQEDLYNGGDCEHAIFWIYRFDGRKLHLVKHDAAD